MNTRVRLGGSIKSSSGWTSRVYNNHITTTSPPYNNHITTSQPYNNHIITTSQPITSQPHQNHHITTDHSPNQRNAGIAVRPAPLALVSHTTSRPGGMREEVGGLEGGGEGCYERG